MENNKAQAQHLNSFMALSTHIPENANLSLVVKAENVGSNEANFSIHNFLCKCFWFFLFEYANLNYLCTMCSHVAAFSSYLFKVFFKP